MSSRSASAIWPARIITSARARVRHSSTSMPVNSTVAAAAVGLPANVSLIAAAPPRPPRNAIVARASGAIAVAPAVISSDRIIHSMKLSDEPGCTGKANSGTDQAMASPAPSTAVARRSRALA